MRLFIGIPLPGEYAQIIRQIQAAWKKRLASKVSWVRPELAHVTLRFLGEVDEDKVPAIVQAMQEAARGSFAAQGGAGGFFPAVGAPRVVWVGLRQGREECAAYFEKLDEGLAQAGFLAESKPFSPHLTVARVKTAARNDEWSALLVDLKKDWPAFTVSHVVLWQSILKPSGPEYRRVAEVELKE
ncbi:2'-5' RNA ligase [Desulfomicrobium macestii]|uniref:RNA 2',3'-cyclic phosphodiesterase n=1 Tax=Desulfomicrobium macestii TaxID=90731 RepID=A0ABR9GY58_9BACT|nr:RNA 2',3'-cyclic phosphodiesterase [Desulfomicrobium macestii]MBE1423395.1 2'-5' RNA ligase [Desulfomicrobium macestii]